MFTDIFCLRKSKSNLKGLIAVLAP